MVRSASLLDGFSPGGFPPFEEGLATSEVDVGRGQVVKALVVAPGIVVIDELGEACLELTRQVVVLEQDAVLHGAMVALDLALGHRMVGPARVCAMPLSWSQQPSWAEM